MLDFLPQELFNIVIDNLVDDVETIVSLRLVSKNINRMVEKTFEQYNKQLTVFVDKLYDKCDIWTKIWINSGLTFNFDACAININTFYKKKERFISMLSDSHLLPINIFADIKDYHNIIKDSQKILKGGVHLDGYYPTIRNDLMFDNYGCQGQHILCCSCVVSNIDYFNWAKNAKDSRFCIDVYLPVELFFGKREGDTIKFKKGSYNVRLRLSQSHWTDLRFENELQRLIKHYHPAPPNILSIEKQNAIHEETHIKYLASLGITQS